MIKQSFTDLVRCRIYEGLSTARAAWIAASLAGPVFDTSLLPKVLPMERFLLLASLVLISLSLVNAGRFRYPVKPGSTLDRFFIGLQIAYNVLSIAVATLLPSFTGFQGLPWLALLRRSTRDPSPGCLSPGASGFRYAEPLH